MKLALNPGRVNNDGGKFSLLGEIGSYCVQQVEKVYDPVSFSPTCTIPQFETQETWKG